ncbi:DoxX family protein [Zhihengliuella halotolerans]|uniref:Putative oxidoreductase n=1 Tax=Zhihengliuella halotolerans TaxID=370736 RepID=A0A4Q8AG98_9MICC|nr:DoxX family protein [Zhihengliuella halotolerans]RZU62723.1 putative oxidoreductase [Zhihengliuella halotolerans]
MDTTVSPASTAARLIVRVVFGFLFLAHGWQKFNEFTIPGTVGAFAGMGVPAAEVVAPIVATLELVGGALLIVGLLTRPVAILLTINMAVALVLVHAPAGVFVADGGYELVLALGAATLALFLVGPGRISLDAALFGKRQGVLAKLA